MAVSSCLIDDGGWAVLQTTTHTSYLLSPERAAGAICITRRGFCVLFDLRSLKEGMKKTQQEFVLEIKNNNPSKDKKKKVPKLLVFNQLTSFLWVMQLQLIVQKALLCCHNLQSS